MSTTTKATDPTATARRYARHFASPECWQVLRAILTAKEPLAAKALVLRADVSRSVGYALLSELRNRGLVENGRDGYTLAPKAAKLVRRMAALRGEVGQ